MNYNEDCMNEVLACCIGGFKYPAFCCMTLHVASDNTLFMVDCC